MKIWPLIALAAAAAASPARADLTATYVADGPGMVMKMKIEVADGGDLRGDMNIPGIYLVKRDGRNYFVMQGPDGLVVEDVEDIGAVMREELSRTKPDLCDSVGQAGSSLKLLPRGTVTIAGRTGEGYATASRERPEVVISRDPALAPLGAAMAAQFRASTAMMGPCAAGVPMVAQMQSLLDSGAPLQFGPMHLETVEVGPVDPARFVLPAAPATRAEIRESMERQKGATVTIAPSPR